MSTFLEALSRKFRTLRTQNNITQEKMAELINVNPRHVVRLEAGKSFTTPNILLSYCRVFGLTIGELFDLEYNDDLSFILNNSQDLIHIDILTTQNGDKIERISNNAKIEIKKLNKFAVCDETFSKLAQKSNKIVIADWRTKNGRDRIEKFFPNGAKVQLFSSQQIKEIQLLTDVINTIKNSALSVSKLNFIKLALDSFHDKKARKILIQMLEGMDIAS